MATQRDIDAAMSAIAKALRPSLRERIAARWRSLTVQDAPSALASEVREEALTLGRFAMGDKAEGFSAARSALENLAMRLGLDVVEDGSWDDGEGYISFDQTELDEALCRARRGQIDDALHHLERALPEGYGDIARRLSHAFRSAR